jgi:hypothetical protein
MTTPNYARAAAEAIHKLRYVLGDSGWFYSELIVADIAPLEDLEVHVQTAIDAATRDKDARIAELEKERDEAQAICRAIRKWAMEELGMGLRGFADEIGVKPSDWANVTRESALDLTKMIPLHMKWKEGTTDEEKAAALAEFDAKEGE